MLTFCTQSKLFMKIHRHISMSECIAVITLFFLILLLHKRGARGVMVIVAGYGHGDTSSNPGPD